MREHLKTIELGSYFVELYHVHATGMLYWITADQSTDGEVPVVNGDLEDAELDAIKDASDKLNVCERCQSDLNDDGQCYECMADFADYCRDVQREQIG